MGVATDAAMAYVDFEGEGDCGNCYGEMDALAMARCCESLVIGHLESWYEKMGSLRRSRGQVWGSSYFVCFIKHGPWLSR